MVLDVSFKLKETSFMVFIVQASLMIVTYDFHLQLYYYTIMNLDLVINICS
jgi:hypothetical protein